MNYWALWMLLQCSFLTMNGSPDHSTSLDELTDKFSTLLYAGNNNIVSLGTSFKVNSNADGNESLEKTIFFVEADSTETGKRVDNGLFVLKDGVRTKLLDNARDIAVVNASKPVYFAAKDGIYIYNEFENTAEKYGSVNDEIISIAAEIDTGVIYFLNKHRQLYKVIERGMNSSVIDTVKNAQEITIDNSGNIYYYVEDKTIYVYNGDNKSNRKVNVTDHVRAVNFIKNSGHLYPNQVFFRDDDKFYIVNGVHATTALLYRNDFTTGATAMTGDVSILIHFARDKKIYEFNALGFILAKVIEDIFKKLK